MDTLDLRKLVLVQRWLFRGGPFFVYFLRGTFWKGLSKSGVQNRQFIFASVLLFAVLFCLPLFKVLKSLFK